MYPQPKAIASYSRVANIESNPLTQVVMLYDGAIKFLNLTAQDIDARNLIAKTDHSNRALDLINYLHSILDFERGGSVAVSLDKLYRSIIALVLRASSELDPALMRRAAELLIPVRDAWETNAQNSRTSAASLAPVPENADAQRIQISQMF